MATPWLKARTPLLASRLFLGCAFTGTESSDMSDTIKDRVLHGETPSSAWILVWKAPRSLGTIMGNDFPGGWHRVLKLSAAVVCSDSPAAIWIGG